MALSACRVRAEPSRGVGGKGRPGSRLVTRPDAEGPRFGRGDWLATGNSYQAPATAVEGTAYVASLAPLQRLRITLLVFKNAKRARSLHRPSAPFARLCGLLRARSLPRAWLADMNCATSQPGSTTLTSDAVIAASRNEMASSCAYTWFC